jgi:hypothetical protein
MIYQIRCVEKLVYQSGGELLFHTDTDSVYTFTLMLSRPDQFTGGRFYIKADANSDESIGAIPSYGGGVIFNTSVLNVFNAPLTNNTYVKHIIIIFINIIIIIIYLF